MERERRAAFKAARRVGVWGWFTARERESRGFGGAIAHWASNRTVVWCLPTLCGSGRHGCAALRERRAEASEAVHFATRVMFDPGTPGDIQRTAVLWNARIACNRGDHGSVLEDLSTLVSFGGSAGAEAQYLMAEHDFNAGAFDACEDKLFGLIEQFYNQDAWKNKGFLLLVQTYIGMNDLFQARATANSILANVQVSEVQEAVADLLLEIEVLEAATTEPNQE